MSNFKCQVAILCFTSGGKDVILHKGDNADLDEADPLVKTYVAKKYLSISTSKNS